MPANPSSAVAAGLSTGDRDARRGIRRGACWAGRSVNGSAHRPPAPAAHPATSAHRRWQAPSPQAPAGPKRHAWRGMAGDAPTHTSRTWGATRASTPAAPSSNAPSAVPSATQITSAPIRSSAGAYGALAARGSRGEHDRHATAGAHALQQRTQQRGIVATGQYQGHRRALGAQAPAGPRLVQQRQRTGACPGHPRPAQRQPAQQIGAPAGALQAPAQIHHGGAQHVVVAIQPAGHLVCRAPQQQRAVVQRAHAGGHAGQRGRIERRRHDAGGQPRPAPAPDSPGNACARSSSQAAETGRAASSSRIAGWVSSRIRVSQVPTIASSAGR